ncbi:hypothetical protein [uncultured Methanobrevibacter sp.]|nr:hypothetical protein [uncultured Methanobrevibacter sp.]
MRRWTIILIAVIIILLIFIVVFYDYSGTHVVNNYSQMETDMRKLWY